MSTQPAKTKVAYIKTRNGLTLTLKGRAYSVSAEDEYYDKTVDLVKNGGTEDEILDFMEQEVNKIKSALKVLDGTDVAVADGVVTYKGDPLHNTLTNRMLEMLEEGFDLGPLGRFLQNLMQNPSKRAVDELYGFMEKGELPITPDGHFLAYKAVRADFKDIHSGTFDNSIGQVCEMPRNKVDDDKSRTCSTGLHFCSVDYLKHFASRDGHVMILKINPKDVVSIPADYNDTKGRCAKYTVIGEYEDFNMSNPNQKAWDKPVVDDSSTYSVNGQNNSWNVTGSNGRFDMSQS